MIDSRIDSYLTFKVKESSAVDTQTKITLEYEANDTLNADLEPVSSFSMENGIISIDVSRTPGDANGDGQVSLKDAVLISRYIAAGWDVMIDTNNADVNRDGQVTLKDAVLINRYLADGWDVQLQ